MLNTQQVPEPPREKEKEANRLLQIAELCEFLPSRGTTTFPGEMGRLQVGCWSSVWRWLAFARGGERRLGELV